MLDNKMNDDQHDKILQFFRLESAGPMDWEGFLQLDQELQVMSTPCYKCSFSWLMSCYVPPHVLRELLTRYESYLFSKRNYKELQECIRIACVRSYVEFIHFVAWKDKELLRKPLRETLHLTKYCYYPLHNTHSLEIAKILVHVHPESLKIQSCEGNLPIHHAMDNERDVEYMKFLIEEGKKIGLDHGGLLVKNKRHQTPLSMVCDEIRKGIDEANLMFPLYRDDLRLWTKLNVILQECQECCSNSLQDCSVTHDHQGVVVNGFQILHTLILSGCPRQAMLMGLLIKPEQIKEVNQSGQFPLSLSASQLSTTNPKSIVLKILHSYPDAVHVPDHNGRLCLHWAAWGGRELGEGTKDILNAYPGALRIADRDGMLPFMLAASSKKDNSLDLVYHLLRECPEYFTGN